MRCCGIPVNFDDLTPYTAVEGIKAKGIQAVVEGERQLQAERGADHLRDVLDRLPRADRQRVRRAAEPGESERHHHPQRRVSDDLKATRSAPRALPERAA
jgi:hypothetical protein